MSRMIKVLLVVIPFVCAVVIMIGWGDSYRISHKWTVKVETPNGPVVGQSVMNFVYDDFPKTLFTNASSSYRIDGEVPVLDLENGKFLALLALYDPGIPLRTYKQKYKAELEGIDFYFSKLIQLMDTDSEVVELDEKNYPIMVVFSDVNSPDSFIETRAIDFKQVVGLGYRLHSITLQKTSEKISQGIVDSIFSWMKIGNRRLNYYYSAPTENVGFMKNLQRSDFVRFVTCDVDPVLVRNLTSGLLDTAIGCKW
jgi:hypothetical protein